MSSAKWRLFRLGLNELSKLWNGWSPCCMCQCLDVKHLVFLSFTYLLYCIWLCCFLWDIYCIFHHFCVHFANSIKQTGYWYAACKRQCQEGGNDPGFGFRNRDKVWHRISIRYWIPGGILSLVGPDISLAKTFDNPFKVIKSTDCRRHNKNKVSFAEIQILLSEAGLFTLGCQTHSSSSHGPFTRYAKLWVVCMHREWRERFPHLPALVSDPDTHQGTCVTHVPWRMPGSLTCGFLWSRWRGKRSRHCRRMRNPQFYLSGKRSIGWIAVAWVLSCLYVCFVSAIVWFNMRITYTLRKSYIHFSIFHRFPIKITFQIQGTHLCIS